MLANLRSVAKGFAGGLAVILMLAIAAGLFMSRDRANQVVRGALKVDGVAHPATHVGGDYFSDCVLLATLTARSENVARNVIETWLPPQIVTEGHPCDMVERHAAGALPYASPPAPEPYVNYWVGTRHLEAVVLRVLSYAAAEHLYLVFSYASILLLALGCWIGDRRASLALLPLFGSLLFAFEVHLQGYSLGHAPGFFVGFSLLGLFAAWRARFGTFESRLGLIAFLAVVTTFFDPLDGQILVLLSLSIVLNYFFYARLAAWRDMVIQSVAIAACFLACFVAFNALHLIVLSFFHDRVWHNYLGSLGVRLGSQAGTKPIGTGDVAVRLWQQRKNLVVGGVGPSTFFLAASLFAWLFAAAGLVFAVCKRCHQRLCVDLAVLSAGGAGVFAWYRLLPNHTYVHAWFMVRTLAVPAAYGLVAMVLVVGTLKKPGGTVGRRSDDLGPSALALTGPRVE